MTQTVYGQLKLFHFANHFQGIYNNKLLAPVHVRIKPTNICNHNCWFCAYRVDNLALGEGMNLRDSIPREKMQEIVRDLIAMKVQAVTFSGGGEPLIYPYIAETAEELGRSGVRVATLTNGSMLKNKVAQVFAEFGTWVRISMDAWDNESMMKFRKTRANEFSQIMQNIENFAKLNSKCVLGISFIVNDKNYEHIYDYCKRVKDLGVNHIKVAGCVVSNNGHENNLYHDKFKEEAMNQILKATSDFNNEHFQVVNHYHETAARFDKDYETCPFTQMLTVIGADSKVYTCQDKAYTEGGLLGSIKDASFKEFWFSEKNLEKIKSINPKKICSHHCVAHQKNILIHDFMGIEKDHVAFV